VTTGVGLNDFLARTIINYPEATIKSYKNVAAETAMKEYVEENCGPSATTANERVADGVLGDFIVELTQNRGLVWEGDRSMLVLLDVLLDISKFSKIDFAVVFDRLINKMIFQTYINQLGSDRSTVGLDHTTAKNGAGNYPVVFSKEKGNVSSLTYVEDGTGEKNSVSVLGDGDGATRTIVHRQSSAITRSRWNRREIARPANGHPNGVDVEVLNMLEVAGDEELNNDKIKEILTVVPLMQASCMYHKHFFVGDKITSKYRTFEQHKRILKIEHRVDTKEELTITFSE
jgi:hypothetical protein